MNVSSKPTPPSSRSRRVGLATLGALLALGLAGCSLFPEPRVDPTRHYVLDGSEALAPEAASGRGSLKVGLRTVRVVPYLDGKAMIVRLGENEIDYRDYARWAEPLSVGVGRLVRARLLASDRVARVLPQPFPFDVARDVDVEITVLRAEALVRADGTRVVSLRCTLEILRAAEGPGAGEVLHRETFVAPEVPWTEGDYAGLARGLGEAAARLADRVTEALPPPATP